MERQGRYDGYGISRTVFENNQSENPTGTWAPTIVRQVIALDSVDGVRDEMFSHDQPGRHAKLGCQLMTRNGVDKMPRLPVQPEERTGRDVGPTPTWIARNGNQRYGVRRSIDQRGNQGGGGKLAIV
jgi:hypothetical protein